jgi:hypothetical protein
VAPIKYALGLIKKFPLFPHHPSLSHSSQLLFPYLIMADIEVFDGAVGIDLGEFDFSNMWTHN